MFKSNTAISGSYEGAGLVVFTGRGTLRSVRVHYNGTASTKVYIQFFDLAAVPANTEPVLLPAIPIRSDADGDALYESDTPLDFVNGCVVVLSSTAQTKTLIGAGDACVLATFNKD